MSKVIKSINNSDFSHIVQTKDGKYYYVDSRFTFDDGLETMVFGCDEDGDVTSWRDLYVRHHRTGDDMRRFHENLIVTLENYLNLRKSERGY